MCRRVFAGRGDGPASRHSHLGGLGHQLLGREVLVVNNAESRFCRLPSKIYAGVLHAAEREEVRAERRPQQVDLEFVVTTSWSRGAFVNAA